MFKCASPVLLLALTAVVSGFDIYKDRIPNGRAVPHPCKPNYLWHGVGHKNALGGGEKNAFGVDFLANGARWSAELCRKDSDGDGRTNGEELGDPQCTWTQGGLPSLTSGITHPGVCEPWDDSKCSESNSWVTCDVGALECDSLKTDPDVRNITIRFPPTPVPNSETNYYCMTFDLPSDDDYHLIAHEPYISNAQVMHHIVLYACEDENPPVISTPTQCGMAAEGGCNSIVGLWTVGFPGSCLKNITGFKFGKNAFKRVRMEMHWNNPEKHSGYTDSSGMILHFTKNLRPQNAAVFVVGQFYLEIPPMQPSVSITGSCPGGCSRYFLKQPIQVFEAINHMHYMGRAQKVEVFRDGQFVTAITNEETYSYDSPILHGHEPPVQILPGDEIRTTCVYSSQNRNFTTFYGDATSAEMCFAFLMVYPAEALNSKACIGQRSLSVCELYGGGLCNIREFLNFSRPATAQIIRGVQQFCTPFSCRPECRTFMDSLSQEPCLQGDYYEYLKGEMMESHEGTRLLAAMESCARRPQCPTCRQCPNDRNSNLVNNNNNGNDPTDSAASLLPQLVVVLLAMLGAALL